MRRRSLPALIGCTVALALVSAPAASAAVEFGDSCSSNTGAPVNATVMTLSAPGGALPLAAPSPGVITKVKMQIGVPLPFPIPFTIKAMRPAGGNLFTVVGEAALATLPSEAASVTVANARIPVQAGDRLALHGEPFAIGETPVPGLILYCAVPGDGSILGVTAGSPPVGSTAAFVAEAEGRAPVAAVLEPDADNDGFGDETQDSCPLSPLVQGACPAVAVDASSVAKRKGSVVVFVTSDASAPVTVAGTANLGKGKKAKLRSKAQTVVPGKVTRFTLNFPRKLKNKLRDLARKRSLKLSITASATDLIGRVTKDTLKTKLKGQAKPTKRGKG